MIASPNSIADAKVRLPLPALLAKLDLSRHARTSARCPLHRDRSPSFSVYHGSRGWRWKCHAGCGEGDEIDFLARLFSLSNSDAVGRFLSLAGGCPSLPAALPSIRKRDLTCAELRLPDDATSGMEADWRSLASLRRITPAAIATAVDLGTLLFGTVCEERCWIVTDERRLCAEARRMNGKPFPAIGELRERKAHTLRGSVKSWPVGLSVRGFALAHFRALLVVEGGPDYLAALHFILDGCHDCLPVAFLGAGAGASIHSEALPLFKGRRLRLYPHYDAGGQGEVAARRWAEQFSSAGAEFDAFDFSGLRKTDGSPIKDLNDCTQIHADDSAELEGLLP